MKTKEICDFCNNRLEYQNAHYQIKLCRNSCIECGAIICNYCSLFNARRLVAIKNKNKQYLICNSCYKEQYFCKYCLRHSNKVCQPESEYETYIDMLPMDIKKVIGKLVINYFYVDGLEVF